MSHRKPMLALALGTLVAAGAHADTQTYGFELSVSPELEVCEKVEHIAEKRCFLTEALKRWWSNGSTEARQVRRATEEMDAERAALDWARQKFPATAFRVRISNAEARRGQPGRARPRKMTLVVESRADDWMTRTRVMVSPTRKGGWAVRKL